MALSKYELGTATVGSGWTTINLTNSYDSAIVIAGVSSYNDSSSPVLVAIKNVTSTSFQAKLVEPPNVTQDHSNETVAYAVFEEGVGSFKDVGARYEAGKQTLSAEKESGGSWQNLADSTDIGETLFGNPLADNFTGNDYCGLRIDAGANGTLNGATIILENAEGNTTSRANTIVHWVKLPYFYSSKLGIEVYKAPTNDSIDEGGPHSDPLVSNAWNSISYLNTYSSTPYVITRIASNEGDDPARSRAKDFSASGISVRVEEDTNFDADVTHANEYVNYFVFQNAIAYEEVIEERVPGDWGLKISLPGYNVWESTENQTVFNSGQNIAKIILGQSGIFNTSDFSENEVSIVHNQNIAPAFLSYKTTGGEIWFRGCGIIASESTGYFTPFTERVLGDFANRNTFTVRLINAIKNKFLVYLEKKTT